ncbi:MAG: phosphoribosylamine--glycine ligase [candidate division Zixibacteria bacterium SM1_73]|nr:MAG: phosphoribosylamine--glycine ligase [candidate division Zixibacteria bacterium SM1_73]
MKVLVIGSGGREHALAWKVAQSPKVKKIFCAPGNAGTMAVAENIPLGATDLKGLSHFAGQEKIDLTIVGPELPLTMGIVDEFEERGLKIFGPDKNAAQLEGSKVFAKQFMDRHKIPTSRFKLAESPDQAKKILESGEFSYPLVIKADGLAAGKGVIICRNVNKADEAIKSIMVDKVFGDAGKRVIVEEFLRGFEASFIAISDGVKVLPLVTTMDHKPIYDGDKGPNTGGMGAISPSPFVDEELFDDIMETIVFPTITRMLEEGRKYKGVLYVGLMLTEEGPKVLEYNCRFGDPETQPQVLRMVSDLVDVILAALEGKVLEAQIKWSQNPAGCVILASGGYPLKYEKGKRIEGLKEASGAKGITIFHAGTEFRDNEYYTAGGRVLGVCASEKTLAETMKKIYRTIFKIYFEAMHFRRDIGVEKEEWI